MSLEDKYKSIELPNGICQDFRHEDESPFGRRVRGEENYTFLLLEIQSLLPPTDCVLSIRFNTDGSNILEHKTFHSMEFRNRFIFENGLYILYLDSIKGINDILKDIRPFDLKFINKRDSKSIARLFYMVTEG